MTRSGLFLALAALMIATSCAHRGPAGDTPAPLVAGPPAADSITTGLWHLDEAGVTRTADAGPFRLDGVAGLDTRSEFGRYRSARVFTKSLDSFVHVPFNGLMNSARGMTIEAWVNPSAYGDYELTAIADRWSPVENTQSWLLGIVGFKKIGALAPLPSPGLYNAFVRNVPRGRLLFVIQPQQAAIPTAVMSTSVVPIDHWTHVAASWDGRIVRLFINGRLDAQFALLGAMRPSPAPLLIGNIFDAQLLSTFSGDLRMAESADPNAYYAFTGLIDEVRLSALARTEFESQGLR